MWPDSVTALVTGVTADPARATARGRDRRQGQDHTEGSVLTETGAVHRVWRQSLRSLDQGAVS